MTEPQPLKGKELHDTIQDARGDWRNLFYVEDVSSAVELLKQELKEMNIRVLNDVLRNEKIDEIFYDAVVK